MTQGKEESSTIWRQLAIVVDGKSFPVGTAVFLQSEGETYRVTMGSKLITQGTTYANENRMPHEADVYPADGPQAGQLVRQIYKFEGDLLIACNAKPGDSRPTRFESKPGSGCTLSVWIKENRSGKEKNI